MSLISRTYTFTDGTVAYGSQVDSEVANIVNTINNLDSASLTWDIVKAVNGSTTPLIADNSTGSNNVFEARVNGVAKVYVDSAGKLQAVNTIAMNSTKVTGLAAAGSANDAMAYGQAGGSLAGLTLTDNLIFNPTTKGITGTTAVNNAAAGTVGESFSAAAGPVNITGSGTYINITSITVTAGDWDVSGVCVASPGTSTNITVNAVTAIAVSTFTGNTTTDHVLGDNLVYAITPSGGANTATSGTVSNWRVNVNTSTTVYLKCSMTFGSNTPTASGRISARRVR